MNGFFDSVGQGLGVLRTLPWVMLALMALPLLSLARWRRIYPHWPLVIAILIPSLLTFTLLIDRDWYLAVVVMDCVVAGVAAFDLLTLPGPRRLEAERQTARVASLGKSQRVELTVINPTPRSFFATIRDDLPEEFTPTIAEFPRVLSPRSRMTLTYEFSSRRRGAFQLDCVYLRVRSRLGFWRAHYQCPATTVVHVYPDMKQLSEYAVLARTNRLSLLGVRRTRRIGQDNEFERLRDYTLDDNYKHIEWRTTARRGKLTVKDFQTNQSQRLIFLLDCGRMMTNQAAGFSLLDHSLNAMLMLSYIALSKGDSVGLICFSDRIHTFIPPRGGMSQMNQLLHASFNRFPNLVESRYDQAFLHLATNCKRRSLVILFSNLIDEVNSHQLEQYLGNLVGRHLPLGVLIRDRRIFEAAEHPHPTDDQLFRTAAAAEILTWRHQVFVDLLHRGVLALDVYPEQMTAPLINQYLEVKARHLL